MGKGRARDGLRPQRYGGISIGRRIPSYHYPTFGSLVMHAKLTTAAEFCSNMGRLRRSICWKDGRDGPLNLQDILVIQSKSIVGNKRSIPLILAVYSQENAPFSKQLATAMQNRAEQIRSRSLAKANSVPPNIK